MRRHTEWDIREGGCMVCEDGRFLEILDVDLSEHNYSDGVMQIEVVQVEEDSDQRIGESFWLSEKELPRLKDVIY